MKVWATGRRKNALAKVWLSPGSGKIVVNGRSVETLGGYLYCG